MLACCLALVGVTYLRCKGLGRHHCCMGPPAAAAFVTHASGLKNTKMPPSAIIYALYALYCRCYACTVVLGYAAAAV